MEETSKSLIRNLLGHPVGGKTRGKGMGEAVARERSPFFSSRLKTACHLVLFSFFVETCLVVAGANLRVLLLCSPTVVALLVLVYSLASKSHHQVYLVDYSCLRPPPRLRAPTSTMMEHMSLIDFFDRGSVDFMSKFVASSGLGEQTYLPPSLHYIPPNTHFQESIKEVHMLLFPVMDELFSKTHLRPADVDILVVNCSGFCPSPSLSSIVVNRYEMRDDVKTFNVSGMGCSASVIAVDLARNLLAVHPNSYAVVLSTEILSTGWYAGKDRRKLLLNCVFRMGSAAVMLTNRSEARRRSKYRLVRVARTQRAFDDVAYNSATREEDSEGITGFTIERDILRPVRETVRSNVVSLGASILPLHEKARYVLYLLGKRWASNKASSTDEHGCGGGPSYVPRFGTVIQHFCTPASGITTVREIGKGVGLTAKDLEPAMATFRRFGNQSSSSIWYQMAYLEARERVRRGDRVWHLGLGSGLKCNSAVWECVGDVKAGVENGGPWQQQ